VTVVLEKPALQQQLGITPCMSDPDRWESGDDNLPEHQRDVDELKTLCRGCPRRWRCATEALTTPGIVGVVAGVHVPAAGRERAFALRQLQSLAAHAGYASQPEIP